jgi:hypothetical protein
MNFTDLHTQYFRKTIGKDQDQLTMDADMISLLLVLDENKNISQIAKSAGMAIPQAQEILGKLLKLKLIEPIEKEITYFKPSFFETLKLSLTKAIGPMGEFLIEDTLDSMGLDINAVPIHAGEELIKQLAVEIPQEESRRNFEEEIVPLIKKG